MSKIYFLSASYGENCSFIEDFSDTRESIMAISRKWNWSTIKDYKPILLELCRSDTGKKNYKFDFSCATNPFLVFSETAVLALKDVLQPRGEFLDIITDSKRRKYIGYYPTNVYPKGILDLEKSDYSEYPNGLVIRKPVLINDKIPNDLHPKTWTPNLRCRLCLILINFV